MMRWQIGMAALAVTLVGLVWSSEAEAQRTAQVPVQVGVGPAGYLLGGPSLDELGWEGRLFDDQPVHGGLRLSLTAVIDSDLVDEHPEMVPAQHRDRLRNMGEVRFAPAIVSLLPTDLYLSPSIDNTSIWGATWSIIGAGVALPSDMLRVSASGSVIATLKNIRSEVLPASNFFFARPGVELQFDFEVPIAERFLMSADWTSKVYLPQDLNGNVADIGEFDGDSLWHVGQFYLQGHIRFPYTHSY